MLQKAFMMLIIGILSVPSPSAEAVTYKWVDENGVSHVSNAPPKGYQVVNPEEEAKKQEAEARKPLHSALSKWRELMRYKAYDLAHMDREQFGAHLRDVKDTFSAITKDPEANIEVRSRVVEDLKEHNVMIETEINRRRNGGMGR